MTLRIDGFSDYPGFEAADVAIRTPILRHMLIQRFSLSLDSIKHDISDEIELGTQDIFGHSPEWTTRTIQSDMSNLASRLISRTMVGKPLCHEDRWHSTIENYARLTFAAASDLRRVNPLVRPVKHWFMKSCIDLRKVSADARSLIAQEIARREKQKIAVLLQIFDRKQTTDDYRLSKTVICRLHRTTGLTGSLKSFGRRRAPRASLQQSSIFR